MAKVLHLSRNTAAKHMRLLEEHGLIITEWTQMKNGIRKNGNLRCTIVPTQEVTGSIPAVSTKKVQESQGFPDFFIFAKINFVSNVLVVAI
jgi:hypothetical protein